VSLTKTEQQIATALSVTHPGLARNRLAQWQEDLDSICAALQRINPRFDRLSFENACRCCGDLPTWPTRKEQTPNE
jgi:hypothetical protein